MNIKTWRTLGLALLLALLFLPSAAVGAGKAAEPAAKSRQQLQSPPAKAGDEVKTDFFSLRLPKGWIMPYPVSHKPDGASAVFGDQKSNVTVTINVIQSPISLKEFTDRIIPDMRKSGLKTGRPVMENGLCKVTIQGSPQGGIWFGSNGRLCTATVILSQSANLSAANELLAVLKTNIPGLFPKKIK